MKPEAQREAMARAHWLPTRHPWFFTEENEYSDYRGNGVFFSRRKRKDSGAGPVYTEPCPDYLNDLAARREAWAMLDDGQRHTMRSMVQQIATERNIWFEEAEFNHWPEAYLRAIGKWVNSENAERTDRSG